MPTINAKKIIWAIWVVLQIAFFPSCVSTKTTVTSGHTFRFKPGDRVIGFIEYEDKINSHFNLKLNEYLKEYKINTYDYLKFDEVLHKYLLHHRLTDSTGLVEIGNITNYDFLLIGVFDESERTGRGFNVLSAHEQIYHDEDYDRWKNLFVEVYNLKNGKKEMFFSSRTKTNGLWFGGEEDDNFDTQTRVYFSSNYKLEKKALKNAIKKLCE